MAPPRVPPCAEQMLGMLRAIPGLAIQPQNGPTATSTLSFDLKSKITRNRDYGPA